MRPASLLLLTLAAPVPAAIQDAVQSPRAEAMGGLSQALSGHPDSLFANPAGLDALDRPGASLVYSKPFRGVEGLDATRGHMALGAPLGKRLSAAAGASVFRAAGLLSEYQTGGGASVNAGPLASAGVSLVYLHRDYEIGRDPAFSGQGVFQNGTAKGGLAVHAGARVKPDPTLELSACARNLNEPDLGLMSRDPVPRELRAGLLKRWSALRAGAELQQRDDGQGRRTVWRLGGELTAGLLSLRGGAHSDGFSAGFGLVLGGLGVDYAFTDAKGASGEAGLSHLMGLSYRFGEARR